MHEGRDAIAVRDPMLVAAPASVVDPLTPWIEPVTSGDRAVSTTFWMSFHGLSAFAHSVAIFLAFAGTLMPIPFIAAMCADVKPVEKPIERVELAVVDVPKPPPPPPVLALADGAGEGVALKSCRVDADCADNETCVEKVCVASAQKHKKVTPKKKGHARKIRDDVAEFGMIGLLSADSGNTAMLSALVSKNDDDIKNALGGLQGVAIGGVEGGVVGGTVGDSYGYGGLGLRGTGEGGGGTGEGIGLGSIGTIGHGSGGGGDLKIGGGSGAGSLAGVEPQGQDVPPRPLRLTVNGNLVNQPGVARMLSTCHVDAPISGTLTISENGKPSKVTTSPANPCVERRLKIGLRLVDFESSDVAYTVAPAAP